MLSISIAWWQEGIPPGSLERLQAVSYFYEHFYRNVQEQGLSTRSLRYRIAADSFDRMSLSGFSEIVFAGFFALTRAEKALFQKTCGNGACVPVFS